MKDCVACGGPTATNQAGDTVHALYMDAARCGSVKVRSAPGRQRA